MMTDRPVDELVPWARQQLLQRGIAPFYTQHARSLLRRASGYELDRDSAMWLVALLQDLTRPVVSILLPDLPRTGQYVPVPQPSPGHRAAYAVRRIWASDEMSRFRIDQYRDRLARIGDEW